MMVGYRRILVATDFSETSEYATLYATELAQKLNAELHVLHVVDCDIPMMAYGTGYVPPNVTEKVVKQAAEKLDQVISSEEQGTLNLTRSLRKGTPFPEIIQYATEHNIDLIVIGTHGRGALAYVMMGSVAEKVVRKAHCPVLTIRHPQHEFKMP